MVCLNLSRSYRDLNYEANSRPGARLFVHKVDSDVLAPVFSDSGLTRMQQNPVIADQNGEFDAAYLMDGAYRIVIRDPDGLILREQNDVIIRSDLNQRVVAEFSSVPEMVSDSLYRPDARQTPFRLVAGDIIKAGGESFPYQVAPDGVEDYHLETAGGVRLYALPSEQGKITARQLGIGLTADDSVQFARFISCLTDDHCRHLVVDTDISLPGANNGFSLTGTDIPHPAVIEFTSDSRVLYDSDGTEAHNYLRLDGVSGLTLIRPWIQGTVTPVQRNARPAIHFLNCTDCHAIDAHIEDTAGSGVLMAASQSCSATRPRVYRTLADGLHITNAETEGPCVNCWTYGGYVEDSGDDGVAIVSYDGGGQPACYDCGHIDFVVSRSEARGASIVGGRGCALRGEVRDCQYQGVLLHQDLTFNTYAPVDCTVEVTVSNCGLLSGAPNVEIGRGARGITGAVRSREGNGRGVQIADVDDGPEDIALDVYERDSNGSAVYCNNVTGLTLKTVHSIRAGREALVLLDCSEVMVGALNLRDYGQVGASVDGVLLDGTSNFVISGGIVVDSTLNSERPVDILNCSNGQVMPLVLSGGFATVPLRSGASNTNVILPELRGKVAVAARSVAAGESFTVNFALIGANPGDAIAAFGYSADLKELAVRPRVLIANAVSVEFTNPTAGSISLPAGDLTVISARQT